ncbi:MAG: recombinase family protein [Deltaproteobacteria bacterium]|nr:recombinase family protein [Deltaproteobacteria bacterium]
MIQLFWVFYTTIKDYLHLVAHSFNHSKSFVLGLLKQYKISLRPKHDNVGKNPNQPFGYQIYHGKRCKDKNKQKTIDLIRNLHTAGQSFRQICYELYLQDITRRKGGKWHPQMIKRILNQA